MLTYIQLVHAKKWPENQMNHLKSEVWQLKACLSISENSYDLLKYSISNTVWMLHTIIYQ